MREWGAVDLLAAAAPPKTAEIRVEALRRATEYYASLGFTWIQDAWIDPCDIDAYITAAERGLLATRCNLALRANPFRWPEQLEEIILARQRIADLSHPLLTANTVKFFRRRRCRERIGGPHRAVSCRSPRPRNDGLDSQGFGGRCGDGRCGWIPSAYPHHW